MATDAADQGQKLCRILVLTDEGEGAENMLFGSQLECQTCADTSVICHNPANQHRESSEPFSSSPCSVSLDIETGGTDVSKINQESGCMNTEFASTKRLRKQNSSHTRISIPPLMNHILMLLKLDPKAEKQAIERAHEASNSRWRKYKRAATFDSRRIVLLFSIMSSMGTILLIYLTLRVREVSDGYI